MSLDSAFEAISGKAANADSIGAKIKFDCGDSGCIMIDATSTPPSVSREDGDADCTVSCEADTLDSLIAGDLDPTAAFMQGKIKIDGDMSIAMKLSSLF